MKSMLTPILFQVLFSIQATCQDRTAQIVPGSIWRDTQGNAINAHGGGILYYSHTYYWFGEIKSGLTTRVSRVSSWEDFRVAAGGVSCYSSKDLVHWQFLGIALKPDTTNPLHDLHTSKVIERPKVIYNAHTHQFVMWMHIDQDDYGYARSGVAVSKTPQGPYQYLASIRPNSQMARDMTLFKDDDGKAYLIYASEDNKTMQVCLLTDDYLSPTKTFSRILINQNREAPAIFKYEHQYYLITSKTTGWSPNMALYAKAEQIMGTWTIYGNPCEGLDADSSFRSQVTFVCKIEGKANDFVFMADRWNKLDLADSKYLWLRLQVIKGRPVVNWESAWSPDAGDNAKK